jgi:hypothetical protein
MKKQDVHKYGLRKICIDKELWDAYPVNEEKLAFFDCGIKYSNNFSVKVTDDYEEVIKKIGYLCPCGGQAATILNGIDIDYLENVNVYSQCPIQKMFCIRRVLNQVNLPDPIFCNEFTQFYINNYHEKFMKAAEKFLYLTPKAMFNNLKNLSKQVEMAPYMDGDFGMDINKTNIQYDQHNKIQLQAIKEKVRQICNPNNVDKFVTMLMEKPLTAMMYEVFGSDYGVGLSTLEKSKEIQAVIDNTIKITLDLTGFDNSHNRFLTQPWKKLIYDCATKYSERFEGIIDQSLIYNQMCKQRSEAVYTFRVHRGLEAINKKYCILNLGPRLASGSCYTTLLNTFIMILAIKFVMHRMGIKQHYNHNSVSGDDALVLITTGLKTKQEIVNHFFSVFAANTDRFISFLGIKLKYCLISEDIKSIVPCSLDTFKCETCGIKMVRHFFKYIRDTFLSEKYLTNFKNLGITEEEFEQLVYEGEMAWGRGLKFVELVMSPLNHGLKIRDIANDIIKKMKHKIQMTKKVDSSYFITYQKLPINYSEMTDAQLAVELLTAIKGENYEKIRNTTYCKDCSFWYDKFLYDKYGIDSNIAAPFYIGTRENVMINSNVVNRNGDYIPAILLRRSEVKYAKFNKQCNKKFTDRYYYFDEKRVKSIPSTVIKVQPDNFKERKNVLINLIKKINEQEDVFVALFQKEFQPLLYYYFDNDMQYEEEIRIPVTKEQVYAKGNTYFRMLINDTTWYMPEPIIKNKYIRQKNRKITKTKVQLYKELNEVKNDRDLVEQLLKKYVQEGKLLENKKIPFMQMPKIDDCITFRKYWITINRFHVETGDERYVKQLEILKQFKYLINV